MGRWRWWLGATTAPAVVLIRIVVGDIFLSEGVQKFVFPEKLSPGRFATQTPLPAPTFVAYLDGEFEIGCEVLLLIGLFTRLATIPMIVTMIGAEIFTKVPLALTHRFFDYLHEARVELSQLFGSVFLLIAGAGTYSLDYRLHVTTRTDEPRASAASSPPR
jgi:uncharacterized membrane protein YphA (DoxX/SURF4 family)